MAFATFFLGVLCDVTSFTVGPTQLLRGGRLKQLLAFSFVFPQLVKMHDWPSMKTGTGGCRAAPRTCLNQSCSPAVLLPSHASQIVLRDLAILVLKNPRATPWPRAGERNLGGRAWLGLSGLFETIASPTPSRKAPAPRVWLKSEKLQWGTAATSQNGRGAKSDYNAAGLPRALSVTVCVSLGPGFCSARVSTSVARTRLIVL